MNKLKAIITIGVSASGKTTWAEQFVKDNKNWVNINRDDIRKNIYETENDLSFSWKNWKWKREDDVTRIQTSLINSAINDRNNIIISNTNLNIKTFNKLKTLLEKNNYNVEVKIFDTRLDICLERDVKRNNSVGFKVIGEQHGKFCEILKHINSYKNYNVSKQPDVVISDLDGTLFLMNGKRGAFEYDKVHLDDVNYHVRETIRGYNALGYKIIFVSGRDDICYEASFNAIKKAFDDKLQFELYMRITGDKRCDTIVKQEMYERYILPKYNVLCVLDDRPKVTNKWRELGLNVLQVGNPYHWF